MRFIYLDNMRALLMILGIVLHTCAGFSVYNYWIVTYVQPLTWVDSVNEFIHFFRMPLFFIISGFFAFLLMQKQSTLRFCKVKICRVGLPFFVVLITINYPQYYVLHSMHEVNLGLNVSADNAFLIGHLWFLSNLLIYFLIYSLIHTGLVYAWGKIKNMNTWLFVFLICLTTPCVYLFCLSLNMLGVPLYYPIPIMGSLFQIFSHIDYFLLGAFLALIPHSRLLSLFSHWKGMAILVVVLILGGLGYFFQDKLPEVLYTYSLRLVVIALCLTILVSGSRVLNSRKHWLKSISDASYTIYLFHHVLVIILLVLLNYLALTHAIVFEPNIAFAFVLLATFSITLGLHFFVIKPNKITKLLFNGKI